MNTNQRQLITKTGNKITYYFETEQGSKYLFSEKGESKRWKSVHVGHDESDKGLKKWYEHCIFVDKKTQYEGNSLQYLYNLKKQIALSVEKNKGLFYINDTNGWRPATWNDAYPKWVSGHREYNNKPLLFLFVEKPTIGYHAFEYNQRSDKTIPDSHFGSIVTKVIQIDKLPDEYLKNFITTK